jgi:DNA-binding NarL/FixJ family response regulator
VDSSSIDSDSRDRILDKPVPTGTVLLADSHSPMLEGIRSLLEERFNVVVMVADERSLLEAVEKLQPDVAIVDVSLPHTSGSNIIAILRERFRDLNLIALSSFADRIVADRILASGAVAVVLKSSAVTDLGPTLDAVGCGLHCVTSSESFTTQRRMQP